MAGIREVKGTENQEVYVTFSPRFERIWLESKKRLPEYVAKEPANIGLRSQYSIRLYAWAKKYVSVGTKRISLEQLAKSARAGVGKGCRRKYHPRSSAVGLGELSPEGAWILRLPEINRKTDLNIAIESLERSKHRRVTSVTFAIKEQAVPDGD